MSAPLITHSAKVLAERRSTSRPLLSRPVDEHPSPACRLRTVLYWNPSTLTLITDFGANLLQLYRSIAPDVYTGFLANNSYNAVASVASDRDLIAIYIGAVET